jgi:hypothetical protein
MSNQIQEAFLEAVSTIVDASSVATFDKTIIGKIIKVYENNPGVYRV